MATRDTSLDRPILASAKKEFLEKKYEKASLKSIAANANVSTGALYIRYKGKEDLFHAVVADFIGELNEICTKKVDTDFSIMSDEDLLKSWIMDEEYMLWWFNFFDRYREEFILLWNCAAGTEFENIQHDLVEMITESAYKCYKEMLSRKLVDVNMSKKEMHVLFTAFWNTIYEPLVHNFTQSEYKEHCKYVCQLFTWKNVFHINV